MDKKFYETALLLAAGAALGQTILILIEMSFRILSFLPVIVVVAVLGVFSLRKIAGYQSLVNSSVKTRLTTGVWILLVWDVLRRRTFAYVDVFKFLLLFAVLYFFYRMLRKRWEE